MAYYYIRDGSNYFTNWSVGAEFSGCSRLPDGVEVPEPLKSCACNVRAYKYENGVITYDPNREAVGDLYPPAANVEYYAGEYDITPKVSAQVMPTAQKFLQEDVTIREIPYYDVSNTTGGSTVYIGTLTDE